jgi:hypothetical protein
VAEEVDAVGASSLAGGHKTLIPELIDALRAAGRADIKVVAGGVIPPQDYQFLRDAGVQGIYGPGSNVVECAADLLRCSATTCRRRARRWGRLRSESSHRFLAMRLMIAPSRHPIMATLMPASGKLASGAASAILFGWLVVAA